MTPLEAAKELVVVLEQMEALQQRRTELIATLGGETPAAAVRAPKAAKGKVSELQPATAIDPLDTIEAMPTDTPEQKEAQMAAANELYMANVEPASDKQKAMMFGILSKQFGIKDDAEAKAVIVAIVAKQHHGEKIISIREELSKQWANGVIDYLLKASNDEIKKLTVPF